MSQWGSDLPPLFLQMVLERLPKGDAGVWGAIQTTCSTWSSILDACCLALEIRSWTAVMEGKMAWFPSVTRVNLRHCEEEKDVSSNLVELRSLPSLRAIELPASCAEREADAEALYGLTTVTTLEFEEQRYDDDGNVEEVGEWVLDLSRLTTLTSLSFKNCPTVTREQVEAASHLTGLTELNLTGCWNVTTKGLCTVSRFTALTTLYLGANPNVTTEVLRAMSGLTTLTTLDVSYCEDVTTEGLCAVIK